MDTFTKIANIIGLIIIIEVMIFLYVLISETIKEKKKNKNLDQICEINSE